MEWESKGSSAHEKPSGLRDFVRSSDDVLMRVCFIGTEGDREVLRPVVHRALRPFIMRNHHSSIWAVHHGFKATLHWSKTRFWWPKMKEEVLQFASRCKICQMAKALKPANQGLLRGRRHSRAMNELCMGLVGPISAAVTGHEQHGRPVYIFAVIDPFTHMIWLECLPAKGGKDVFRAFVHRMLLEEGAPRVIRCDNGIEFKNVLLNDLCRELHIQMQFSPAYWPQGNQCERLNRYIGEALRCMTNTRNGRKQDWYHYAKYIELAYRSTPIAGTQLTPFEAARGRLPRLVSDNPLLDSELPPEQTLDEHIKGMKALMELAADELKVAKEKVLRSKKDLNDLHRSDESFVKDEVVLFYNRLVGMEGDPSKLRLRTYLYRVLEREGDIYSLQSLKFPDSKRRAHVGQLIRFKGDLRVIDEEEAKAEKAATEAATAGLLTDEAKGSKSLEEGRFVALRLKDDLRSEIRCAEVLSTAWRDSDDEVSVWYYLDGRVTHYNDFEMPLQHRKLVPAWYDDAGMVHLHPTRKHVAAGNLFKRAPVVSREEVEIIVPRWTLMTGGKVPPAACAAAEM